MAGQTTAVSYSTKDDLLGLDRYNALIALAAHQFVAGFGYFDRQDENALTEPAIHQTDYLFLHCIAIPLLSTNADIKIGSHESHDPLGYNNKGSTKSRAHCVTTSLFDLEFFVDLLLLALGFAAILWRVS